MLEYITKDGDRWDLIAWRFYGDATLIAPLLQANSEYMHLFQLPAGIKLKIPEVYLEDIKEVAPPWQTDY